MICFCFKINTGKGSRGQCFTLVKGQSRLGVRKYSLSQGTIGLHEWNKLAADCVLSIGIYMYRIDNYVERAGFTKIDT